MPGKSRRGRHKHSARIKKRQEALARAAPEHVPVETREPVAPVAPSGVPTPVVAPTGARYHYIVTELRTIGILAGIMIVILVVLALVLP